MTYMRLPEPFDDQIFDLVHGFKSDPSKDVWQRGIVRVRAYSLVPPEAVP